MRFCGADYLAYALLDAVIDGSFPLLESLGDRLTAVEEAVLSSPTRETLGEAGVEVEGPAETVDCLPNRPSRGRRIGAPWRLQPHPSSTACPDRAGRVLGP